MVGVTQRVNGGEARYQDCPRPDGASDGPCKEFNTVNLREEVGGDGPWSKAPGREESFYRAGAEPVQGGRLGDNVLDTC